MEKIKHPDFDDLSEEETEIEEKRNKVWNEWAKAQEKEKLK